MSALSIAAKKPLLHLIDDLLGFARIESGRVEYRYESVRIVDVVEDIDPMIAPLLSSKPIQFRTVAPDPTIVVLADRDKVVHMLLNLITNAIKFTERGEITLQSSVAGDVVTMSVRDTGAGIDASRLESIFEPFVQLKGGYTRTTQGAGLGLTISRELARAMGGDLKATSTPGEGSTFSLALPVSTATRLP
jgi:signal transduction histidine kinase